MKNSNYNSWVAGMTPEGRIIPTPEYAEVIRRAGYDPVTFKRYDPDRGYATDAEPYTAPPPDPDRGRWPPPNRALDQAPQPGDEFLDLEPFDSFSPAVADENVFAQAYERRCDQIFDSTKSTTQKRFIGDAAAHQGRNDLEAFDKEMQAWTAKYLRAQTPGELRDAISKFRAQCNDYTTPDSSVEHLVAYERAAERERTKPRTPRERIAAARWPWSAR